MEFGWASKVFWIVLIDLVRETESRCAGGGAPNSDPNTQR
jgi:hypothetical protein